MRPGRRGARLSVVGGYCSATPRLLLLFGCDRVCLHAPPLYTSALFVRLGSMGLKPLAGCPLRLLVAPPSVRHAQVVHDRRRPVVRRATRQRCMPCRMWCPSRPAVISRCHIACGNDGSRQRFSCQPKFSHSYVRRETMPSQSRRYYRDKSSRPAAARNENQRLNASKSHQQEVSTPSAAHVSVRSTTETLGGKQQQQMNGMYSKGN